MRNGWIIAGAAVGALALLEAGISAYFYRRTMIRSNAKRERTIKMAGTDWNQYMPLIQERKEKLLAQPLEDVFLTSEDGLKLHGTWVKNTDGKETTKVVICFHGYTSEGLSDYIGHSDYYLRNGYAMLLPDARAHGQSEGHYIGFGCKDRYDARKWIDWVINRCGSDVQILLHGTSMGGATVLMTGGLELPPQIKGIVSDCAFTSPKYVFTHVLHSMYHMPAFPIIQIADAVNKKKAGYGLDECNAAREAAKIKVPVLFIHGSEDTFVPCSMCDEIYDSCSAPKTKVIVEGAHHAESYYKDTGTYEKALDSFTGGIIK
ncbi:MAG: alpha/beta hydrolase [Lachnospiraceae bacterium]|nr:alpha/beta hydrolase [Lachnospiraceae bacterium]